MHSRGQTMLLFALTMIFLALMVAMTLSIAVRVRDRMDLQTSADAAAYSNAVATARTMNSMAVMNRVQIANTVTVIGTDALDFVQVKAEKIPAETFKPSASIPWSADTSALKPGTGALGFDVAPSTPTLPALTLNGAAQTTHATMNEMAVDDTTAGTGWNITVAGSTAGGKSAVF